MSRQVRRRETGVPEEKKESKKQPSVTSKTGGAEGEKGAGSVTQYAPSRFVHVQSVPFFIKE